MREEYFLPEELTRAEKPTSHVILYLFVLGAIILIIGIGLFFFIPPDAKVFSYMIMIVGAVALVFTLMLRIIIGNAPHQTKKVTNSL